MSATNAAPPGRVAAPSRASRFAPSAFLGKPPSYGGNDGANAAASGSGKSSRIDQRAARLSSASLGRKAFAGSVGASLWVRPVGSCSRASCRTYADRELRERERERGRERATERRKKSRSRFQRSLGGFRSLPRFFAPLLNFKKKKLFLFFQPSPALQRRRRQRLLPPDRPRRPFPRPLRVRRGKDAEARDDPDVGHGRGSQGLGRGAQGGLPRALRR